MTSRMIRALVLLVVMVPVGACASAQAKAPVEKAALEVPPVPPRAVEPPPPPPPDPVPALPAETPSGSSTSPTSSSRKPQTREQNRETVKPPEAKPAEPPPPAETQLPVPAPVVPALRTPETPAASDAASRQVRDNIDRVRKTLESIDAKVLKPELRKEYDNAKLFLQQAEDAIGKVNFELARSLADKADRIAKQLQGR